MCSGSGRSGGSKSGVLPVEALADVVGVVHAHRRGVGARPVEVETEAVHDQLEDRLVPVAAVVDADTRAPRAVARPRRDRHGRDAEAHLAEVLVEVGALAVVRDARRRDVVEEPAPLVVDDEERAALVVRATRRTRHDVGHERLAEAHVAVRVLVGRVAVEAAAVAERRVDDRDVRQRPGRAVGVVLGDRPRPRRAARAPDRRERQVRVVVAARVEASGCASARSKIVSHWLPSVSTGGGVVVLAARLPRPLVVAVRPRRAELRAEAAVVERVRAARRRG